MQSPVKAGLNWCELQQGIQIFGFSGENQPAGCIVEGIVRDEHWLLNSPSGLVALSPYEVASELYASDSYDPLLLNPVTAVTLYLDNGFSLEELVRSTETDDYIAFTVIRYKRNVEIVISNGTGPAWTDKGAAMASVPRPKQKLRDERRLLQPRWLNS